MGVVLHAMQIKYNNQIARLHGHVKGALIEAQEKLVVSTNEIMAKAELLHQSNKARESEFFFGTPVCLQIRLAREICIKRLPSHVTWSNH